MSDEKHPTAVIDSGAVLGNGVRVGPFAFVESGTVIGDECIIGAHAVIKTGTRLGARSRVYEGAVLGGPPQDLKYRGGESFLEIGDDNVIREGATLHRSATAGGATRIGSGNYLMANVHIAHDCVLGDSVIIANNVCLAGHVDIQDHAFISGGVVIHQYCLIGRLSMIGGNAKVVQDVLPFFLVDGVPARTRGLNLVGLRRASFGRDKIQALKQARRILFSDSSPLRSKLDRLGELDSDAVGILRAFIEKSERGFCPAAKSLSKHD